MCRPAGRPRELARGRASTCVWMCLHKRVCDSLQTTGTHLLCMNAYTGWLDLAATTALFNQPRKRKFYPQLRPSIFSPALCFLFFNPFTVQLFLATEQGHRSLPFLRSRLGYLQRAGWPQVSVRRPFEPRLFRARPAENSNVQSYLIDRFCPSVGRIPRSSLQTDAQVARQLFINGKFAPGGGIMKSSPFRLPWNTCNPITSAGAARRDPETH